MTDNDIKKALECCIVYENCEDCPCAEDNSQYCLKATCKNALDLINRQQAEIEKLNVDLVGMRGACESYKMHYDKAQTEIERLTVNKNACALGMERLAEQLEQAKSEVIKEFAERLKQEIQESKYRVNDSPYARACNQVADWCIEVSNELVKEMTKSPTKIEHSSLCETESFKFAIDEDGTLTIVGEPKKCQRKNIESCSTKKHRNIVEGVNQNDKR